MSLGIRRSFTLAAMLALAGSAFGAPAMAQDEPQPGGTIIFGEWQPATQLNAYFTTAFTNVEAYSPVFRGLFNVNADGEWFGDLATEVPTVEAGSIVEDPSGDGFTVTMTMKPGLVWSDGEPLDMNDQKWTYDWAVEVAKSGVGCTGCSNLVPTIATTDANGDPLDLEAQYAPENQYVESITVSDDGLSMDVKYRKNFAGWIGQWGTVNSPIMPQQYFESIAYADLPSSVPLGSGIENVPAAGPFKFSAASSDGIDYVRNDLWNGGTKPLLDGLKFRFFGSKDGQITAFLNGEIDLALDMTQADYLPSRVWTPRSARPSSTRSGSTSTSTSTWPGRRRASMTSPCARRWPWRLTSRTSSTSSSPARSWSRRAPRRRQGHGGVMTRSSARRTTPRGPRLCWTRLAGS